MVTKQWLAVHRKHHAKCDTSRRPAQPAVLGLSGCSGGGAAVRGRSAQPRNAEPLRPRHARRLARAQALQLALTRRWASLHGLIDMALSACCRARWCWWCRSRGFRSGPPAWSTASPLLGLPQLAGVGPSTNIFPIGLLIGGEELHNQPPRVPDSAKLSNKWVRVRRLGFYIRALQAVGFAKVKHLAPSQRATTPAPPSTPPAHVQAVIRPPLRRAAKLLALAEAGLFAELARTHVLAPNKAAHCAPRSPGSARKKSARRHAPCATHASAGASQALETMYAMRRELTALWTVRERDRRAAREASAGLVRTRRSRGIAPLAAFAVRCVSTLRPAFAGAVRPPDLHHHIERDGPAQRGAHRGVRLGPLHQVAQVCSARPPRRSHAHGCGWGRRARRPLAERPRLSRLATKNTIEFVNAMPIAPPAWRSRSFRNFARAARNNHRAMALQRCLRWPSHGRSREIPPWGPLESAGPTPRARAVLSGSELLGIRREVAREGVPWLPDVLGRAHGAAP